MECVPDLAFLQLAAASHGDRYNEMYKMVWPSGGGGGGAVAGGGGSPTTVGAATTMKQRKTNFTSREVEALLSAVAERKETVLFGVAGGMGWARAWHEVARQVSAVEGIHRSESDVRKKWTYLKWEAKNTSKPGRDPTSRAVLDILTSRDREAAAAGSAATPHPGGTNSLLEQLLVPQGGGGSVPGGQGQSPGSPSPVVPIAPKKVPVAVAAAPPPAAAAPPQPAPPSSPPEVCLRWNSYHSNMQATFPSLLNNEQFVDVTLACEGRSIKCHKVMLSACSSYFEELLSQNPCQHPIVFMRDLKFWEVQALVEFMYSGEVNVAQDKLPSLLAAAEALQIKGLTGPSTGSSSHDEDSLPVPELDDSLTPTNLHKRVRKRKAPTTPVFLNKPQIMQSHTAPIMRQIKLQGSSHGVPHSHAPPPAPSYIPPSPRSTPPLPLPVPPLTKIKREESPPRVAAVKSEPIEIQMEYPSDQGDSDTGQNMDQRELQSNHDPLRISDQSKCEPGPLRLVKEPTQDNGLSDDDQTASSDSSDERFPSQIQMDPGESNNST